MSKEINYTLGPDGLIRGAIGRDQAKNPEYQTLAVSLLIVNSKGEMALQQRSLEKDVLPGVWSLPVAGYPLAHLLELPPEAVCREAWEEVGWSPTQIIPVAQADQILPNGKRQQMRYFICYLDEGAQLTPNPTEVEQVAFFNQSQFESLCQSGDRVNPLHLPIVKAFYQGDLNSQLQQLANTSSAA